MLGPMGGVTFSEKLEGWIGARELDVNQGVITGRRDDTRLLLELEMDVPDVDAVVRDTGSPAQARGFVSSPLLGGRCEVLEGSTFHLLQARPEQRSFRMLYRLFTRDAGGAPVTVSGFKVVFDDRGWDVWTDTTSLHTRLLRGHLDKDAEDRAGADEVLGAGIVEITLPVFLRLMAGMKGDVGDRLRFGRAFFGTLWDVYSGRAGSIQDAFADPTPDVEQEPAWFARLRERGVHGEIVPFRAGDGLPLKLGHFRGDAEPTRGPVLVVAGTGVRGAIFSSAPQPVTMVDALVREGYDVWVEDWRASIDFPPLRYTLDQAAVFDHPAAVREIRERTGAREHQGARALPGIDELHDVLAGRARRRRADRRLQRRLPAPGRHEALAGEALAPHAGRVAHLRRHRPAVGGATPDADAQGAREVGPASRATTATSRRASCRSTSTAPARTSCGATRTSTPRRTTGSRVSSATSRSASSARSSPR